MIFNFYIKNGKMDELAFDLEELQEFFPILNRNIFLLVCKYNQTDKIEYLIAKTFGLDYIDENRDTGFHWLCKHKNYDCINLLLDCNELPKSYYFIRNIDGLLGIDHLITGDFDPKYAYKIAKRIFNITTDISPIDTYTKRIFNITTVIRPIDNKTIDTETYEINHTDEQINCIVINTYKMNDFSIIKYNKKFEGNHGEILHVVHRKTNENMVVKKFKNKSLICSIKEISFLKYLQARSFKSAVILKGLIYEDNTIYLVFEHLTHTLKDHFNYTDKNDVDVWKDLIYQTVEIVNDLNTLGISHNDIKYDNIMFDIQGKMKLIDFGICDYLGLFPHKSIYGNIHMDFNRIPPEISPKYDLYENTLLNSPGIRSIPINLRTLNLDIFTVGLMFLYKPKTFYKKLIYQNELYEIKNKDVFKMFKIAKFTDEISNILYNFIDSNYKVRPYPKDILNSFPNVSLNDKTEEVVNFTSIPTFNQYKAYTHNLDRELKYKDEIFHSLLQCKLQNTNFSTGTNRFLSFSTGTNRFLSFSNELLKLSNLLNVSLDIYLNSINLLRTILLTIGENECDEFEGIGLCCFNIYLTIYNQEIEYHQLGTITRYKYSEKQIITITNKILTNGVGYDPYLFTPISSQIGYVVYKMQENNFENETIKIVHAKLQKSLIIYVNFNDEKEIPTWDIVRYSYYFINENNFNNSLSDLGILDNINIEDLNRIQTILKNHKLTETNFLVLHN